MARPALVASGILDLMRTRDAPHTWTLREIRRRLGETPLACDPSTVFRAVNRLVAEGALVRLPGRGRDGHRYEVAAAHHDHLLCRRCRRLFPVPCPLGPAAAARLGDATGHRIDGHELVLDGLCQHCRKRPDGPAGRRPRARRSAPSTPRPRHSGDPAS